MAPPHRPPPRHAGFRHMFPFTTALVRYVTELAEAEIPPPVPDWARLYEIDPPVKKMLQEARQSKPPPALRAA